MNRRALLIAGGGAILFLLVLFGYYLPRQRALVRAERTAELKLHDLQGLETEVLTILPKPVSVPELAGGRFSRRILRELNVTLIHEELVRLGRTSGEIAVESITELSGRERMEEGVIKLPIRLQLRASYSDFARLLEAIDRSGLPLAVESFSIGNPDNISPSSRIELTLAAVADPAEE